MVPVGMDILGRWIRESRVRAGMSQAQLARRAGMHQSTLSRLERGQLEGLRLHRLAALIAVLDDALGGTLFRSHP
jgi:transcriptional regulator with XRE-family HTH domain